MQSTREFSACTGRFVKAGWDTKPPGRYSRRVAGTAAIIHILPRRRIDDTEKPLTPALSPSEGEREQTRQLLGVAADVSPLKHHPQ